MNKPYLCRNFCPTDWSHMRRKNTIEISSIYFYGFFQTDKENILKLFQNFPENTCSRDHLRKIFRYLVSEKGLSCRPFPMNFVKSFQNNYWKSVMEGCSSIVKTLETKFITQISFLKSALLGFFLFKMNSSFLNRQILSQ